MIAIIDYGLNPTNDLTNAIKSLGIEFIVTHNEKEILNCNKVIISDASNISKAIKRFHLFNLFSLLRFLKKPILGISLGMDLLCNKTNDGIACLGVIETDVINNVITDATILIPKMKKVEIIKENKLLENIKSGAEFYFSSNYHVDITDSTIAISDGETIFSAAIQKDNFYGVQFLPEKSGENGLQIIKNFILNIS